MRRVVTESLPSIRHSKERHRAHSRMRPTGTGSNQRGPRHCSNRRWRNGAWLDYYSAARPLAAQLRPVIQPLPDLALEAAFGRIVEILPWQRVGKIILAGKGVLGVVIIGIAAAIAFFLHQPRRRIQ